MFFTTSFENLPIMILPISAFGFHMGSTYPHLPIDPTPAQTRTSACQRRSCFVSISVSISAPAWFRPGCTCRRPCPDGPHDGLQVRRDPRKAQFALGAPDRPRVRPDHRPVGTRSHREGHPRSHARSHPSSTAFTERPPHISRLKTAPSPAPRFIETPHKRILSILAVDDWRSKIDDGRLAERC